MQTVRTLGGQGGHTISNTRRSYIVEYRLLKIFLTARQIQTECYFKNRRNYIPRDADFRRSCPQAQSWFYNYTEQGYTVTVVRLHGTRLAQRTQTESTTGLNPGRQLAHATLHGNNIDKIAERTCTIKLWRRRPYSWQPACTPASIQGQCLMLLAEPVLTGGAS